VSAFEVTYNYLLSWPSNVFAALHVVYKTAKWQHRWCGRDL